MHAGSRCLWIKSRICSHCSQPSLPQRRSRFCNRAHSLVTSMSTGINPYILWVHPTRQFHKQHSWLLRWASAHTDVSINLSSWFLRTTVIDGKVSVGYKTTTIKGIDNHPYHYRRRSHWSVCCDDVVEWKHPSPVRKLRGSTSWC